MAQTVYLVDDNASALQHNIITFKQAGIEVIGYTTDPMAALKELEAKTGKGSPDIICLDIIMPEMDGIELHRKLKALKPSWRIIFVTALAVEHKFVGHFAQSIGADKFLPKPLSVANLQQVLTHQEPADAQAAVAEAGAKAEAPAKPATPPPPPAPAASTPPEAASTPPKAPSTPPPPPVPTAQPKPTAQPEDSSPQTGQGEHIAPYGRDPKL